MLGWTAAITFSNWAWGITVLQLDAAVFPAGGWSQRPLIVIAGASGVTFEVFACWLWPEAAALGVAAAGAPGFGAASSDFELISWPQEREPSSRQTKPYRVILKLPR